MRLRRGGGRAGGFRGLAQPAAVPPIVRAALERAHALTAAGDFSGAAAIYARLAEEAYARARPRPGVQMDLAAGHSWLQAGDCAQAEACARHALHYLLPARRPGPALALVEQIVQTLTAQGHGAEAQRLQAEVAALLQGAGLEAGGPAAAPPAPPAGRLPAACPACGAPLRPAELEWVEADRAACAYCGTIILTQ